MLFFQCFMDLDKTHIIEHDQIKQGRFIGKGSYGDVFMAELSHGNNNNNNGSRNTSIQIAMKIPINSEIEKNQIMMATMFSYDTYRYILMLIVETLCSFVKKVSFEHQGLFLVLVSYVISQFFVRLTRVDLIVLDDTDISLYNLLADTDIVLNTEISL